MYEHQRKELIKSLYNKGINDEKVLKAIYDVPRHLFVLEVFQDKAYDDNALPLIAAQTISQPFTVAFQTQLLEITKGDKILEIGTGSGYQSAILANLGARVFTIERISDLHQKAQQLFDSLHLNIAARFGDGTLGWNEFAPFNGIIVTAAAPKIPDNLLKQLAISGKMVIPVGNKDSQKMLKIVKVDDTNFESFEYSDFRFVPLIGRDGWQQK